MDSPTDEDQRQIRLLSISHYVYGVIASVFSVVITAAIGFSLWMFSHPEKFSPQTSRPPDWFHWIWGFLALSSISFALLHTAGIFVAGRFLATYRHRIFCIVVAGFNCMHFPLGLLLGVFTIIVLCRPSVQRLFDQRPGPPETPITPI